MLSRVADSIYWMSRYIERAENIARYINVNLSLMLDQQPDGQNQWDALIQITGDHAAFKAKHGAATLASVTNFLAFDRDHPNSIFSCVRAARENARTVREAISSEMWEYLNRLYLKVRDRAAAKDLFQIEEGSQFFTEIRLAGNLFDGITDNTMTHNEGWHFCRLGRMLERADKTSRLLDVKYFLLLPSLSDIGTPYDELQWSALLRSSSAYEMYRKRHGRITPDKVVAFLVLDHEFPRAMLYCIARAQESLHNITGTPLGTFANTAEQQLGSLRSQLAFSSAKDIIRSGLHEFIDEFQTTLNEVDASIFQNFFEIRTVQD
ncbi:MAG TPA: alpha-E domain-containing protein [Kiritimatiellia bacterium]|nr:alpha-E domain-containing protein [Kiritimatiellia bacterium]HMP33863.1 alpha-E domain-containing protein [Kiritimatiellia bacterium]